MTGQAGEPAAVCNVPRLFVGGIPAECTVEQLQSLFEPFAARGLRALNLVKRPDGVSKGCAMVLFERWAEAEAAQEAHNGKTRINGGRPLVVAFANPKRIRPGEPPEPAIAPRKLFVGQVPKDATERDLRPLFEPFGEIVCLNVLRTQRGQGPSAGCAFVEFRKWAQAERAMEAHNGVTRLQGSEMPLVVKFADAKRPEVQYGGHMHGRHGWLDMHGRPDMHGLPLHSFPGPQGYGMRGSPLQYGGGVQYGMPNANGLNPLNLAPNQLLSMEAAQNPLTAGLSPAPLQLSADGNPAPGASPTAADAETASLLSLGNLSLSDPQGAGMNGTAGGNGLGGNVSLPVDNVSIAESAALNAAINAGTASALADALANDNTSTANLLVAQQVLQQQQQQAAGGQLPPLQTPIGSLPDGAPANSSPSALAAGFASLNPADMLASTSAAAVAAAAAGTLHASHNGLANGLSDGLNYLGGVAPQLGGARLGGAPSLAPGVGINARGLDQAASQWKLFIGQVPMEATEQDLWGLFSPIGEILELYVLRNNQTGRSRGCAFVTYASRQLAQQAITALNGRQVGGGKNLVVKFADRVPT